MSEVESGLPSGWTAAPLHEVAESCLGKMLDKAKHTSGKSLPYLRNINVRWGNFDLSDLAQMYFDDDELERFGLRPKDVLVCEGGEPGRAAVWREAVTGMKFQKALHRIRPSLALVPEWLVHSLKFDADGGRLSALFTGTTIKHLTGTSLARYEVRLPPLNEQKRIVAKIEALQARSEAAREALNAIPPLLEKFRQSVLAAAFRGDLTKEWREAHPDTDPASKLLERIRAERRRKWEEANPKKKYVEPEPVNTEGLSELPEGWCWASLDELTVWGPQNGLYVPKTQYGGAIPILRIDDYQIDWSRQSGELQRIDVPQGEVDKYALQVGDLVVNRVNSPSHLGKSLVVRERHIPAVFESNMMRLRLAEDVSPSLVHHYLSSSGGKPG